MTLKPNDMAVSKMRAKDARGGSIRFNNARLRAPKLEVCKLGEVGQLKTTYEVGCR